MCVISYNKMNKSQLIDMNRRFNERLNELVSMKGQNTQFFTSESYAQMIQKVKTAKCKVSNKKPEDYQRLKRFDIMIVEETEKLIVPVKEDNIIKFYVYKEEIFQILHDAHLATGHSGRCKMQKELNSRYKNITREMIVIYLNLCNHCEKKRKVPTQDAPTSLAKMRSEMNSRCQVDLINMRSLENDLYKFILVYCDDRTKFMQLRPLKSERVAEIAYVLLDIFTIFGAPSILYSNSGMEFARKIVKQICNMWPEVKIVHGKPRPSQNQERPRQDIENMLISWLQANKSQTWLEGLRYIQLKINGSHHTGLNCSPYEVMFGTKLKLGLTSSVPQEILFDINSEDDLERLIIKNTTTNEVQVTEDGNIYSSGLNQASIPIDHNNQAIHNDTINYEDQTKTEGMDTNTYLSDTDHLSFPTIYDVKREDSTFFGKIVQIKTEMESNASASSSQVTIKVDSDVKKEDSRFDWKKVQIKEEFE